MARRRSSQARSASEGCTSTTSHVLTIPAPKTFDLATAVTSYGFFMLAPNIWVKADPLVPGSQAAFERPLQTADGTAVPVRITQSTSDARTELSVTVQTPAALSASDEQQIQSQVVRMLSLAPADVDVVAALHNMHAEAKAENFGHMFRSPTLWEDMVKSITLCNCGWGRTISMNALLCSEVSDGAFPTPAQVATLGPEMLQDRCGVGYRGRTIVHLAQRFLNGAVPAFDFERPAGDANILYKTLLPLPGMGPFTAANVLQLLGHFERIPADTETARHLKQRHKLSGLTPRTLQEAAQKVYDKYAPFQFLVYWFELRQGYVELFGSLADMDPADYAKATGHIMRAGAAAAASGAAVAEGPQTPQLAAAVAAETASAGAPVPLNCAAEEAGAATNGESPSGRKRRRGSRSSGSKAEGTLNGADAGSIEVSKTRVEDSGGPATPALAIRTRVAKLRGQK